MNHSSNQKNARVSSKLATFIVIAIASTLVLGACEEKPTHVKKTREERKLKRALKSLKLKEPQQDYDTYFAPDGYGASEAPTSEYEYDYH